MTEARQLFSKPMDELRERFVRNRFAEPKGFAFHGVETWLAEQREAQQPDFDGWHRWRGSDFVIACAATAPLAILRECATALSSPPDVDQYHRLFPNLQELALPLLWALHHSAAFDDLYYGYDGGCLLPVQRGSTPDEARQLRVVCEQLRAFAVFPPATHPEDELRVSRFTVDVLFAEWCRNRSRWRAAREFLCKALADEVSRERVRAEEDFDTAVAVSADGTKIVHADWVIVIPVAEDNTSGFLMRHAYELPVWPAASFMRAKILRDVHMLRTDFPQSIDRWGFSAGADEILTAEFAGKIGYAVARRDAGDFVRQRQIYCEVNMPSGMQRLLITASNLCPSPLPDGGVEVAV